MGRPDAAAQRLVDESCLWLPPHRIARYQWSKVIGGLVVCLIFSGWLVLQWSNPVMRWLAGGLIAVTVWVVGASIAADLRRGRGRQVAIVGGQVIVTTPGGTTSTCLAHVADAQWRDQNQPGLWLFDAQGQVLARLDTDLLADQAEARSFLRWARQRADLPFQVRWPDTSAGTCQP